MNVDLLTYQSHRVDKWTECNSWNTYCYVLILFYEHKNVNRMTFSLWLLWKEEKFGLINLKHSHETYVHIVSWSPAYLNTNSHKRWHVRQLMIIRYNANLFFTNVSRAPSLIKHKQEKDLLLNSEFCTNIKSVEIKRMRKFIETSANSISQRHCRFFYTQFEKYFLLWTNCTRGNLLRVDSFNAITDTHLLVQMLILIQINK